MCTWKTIPRHINMRSNDVYVSVFMVTHDSNCIPTTTKSAKSNIVAIKPWRLEETIFSSLGFENEE